MTVYTATRTCTCVRRSSLRSCYSQPLFSYVPPCTIANTCARCLHTATAMRQWLHGGRSFRVALFSINVWAHTWCASTVRPIKANYLKILIITIRLLYRDPMPLLSKSMVFLILQHYALLPLVRDAAQLFLTAVMKRTELYVTVSEKRGQSSQKINFQLAVPTNSMKSAL